MEKSKLMMVIIIALLVLLLGTVVGVSVYVMSLVNNPPAVDLTTPPSKIIPLEDTDSVSLGNDIVTNLAPGDDKNRHFIRVNGSITYDMSQKKDSDAFAAIINNNIHIARSVALSCIMNSTFEELSDPDGKAILEDRILQRLREEFDSTLIVGVYLNDYLLQ